MNHAVLITTFPDSPELQKTASEERMDIIFTNTIELTSVIKEAAKEYSHCIVACEPDIAPQLNEEFLSFRVIHENILSPRERTDKKIKLNINRQKVTFSREMQLKRPASPEILKRRATLTTRNILRYKLAGLRGKRYHDLPYAARQSIDRMLVGKQQIVMRLATKLLPQKRRDDLQRIVNRRFLQQKKVEESVIPVPFYRMVKSTKPALGYDSMLDRGNEQQKIELIRRAARKLAMYYLD